MTQYALADRTLTQLQIIALMFCVKLFSAMQMSLSSRYNGLRLRQCPELIFSHEHQCVDWDHLNSWASERAISDEDMLKLQHPLHGEFDCVQELVHFY